MQAPTFLDLAGWPLPEDMDGMSLKPVILGEETDCDAVSIFPCTVLIHMTSVYWDQVRIGFVEYAIGATFGKRTVTSHVNLHLCIERNVSNVVTFRWCKMQQP